ncbi:hypothetical protein OENI_30022 [Oenococcus oeni]|nr:hypothetical protein OENI_30022 [Oenococcus oeni]
MDFYKTRYHLFKQNTASLYSLYSSKNYTIENQQTKTVPINDGNLDWKKLLDNFDGTLPIALEYPVDSIENLKKDIKSLEEYLEKRRLRWQI